MNRKVRNKRRHVGTKAKIHDKEKHCARGRIIEKKITNSRSSLEQKK
jgi:hypothetical protein